MASIDEEIKSKFIDDRHRFAVNILFTSGWIKNNFTEFLKPFGISSQQFNILRILRGSNEWLAMSVIKELMVEKAPNATRLSDKLLNKELIKRRRSETDRRVVYLKIDQRGLELLQTIDEMQKKDEMSFMDKVTQEEAKMVSEILDRIRS